MSSRPNLIGAATEGLGRSMPPRLSLDANRFTLVDSAGNQIPVNSLSLDIVILDINLKASKLYFGKDYNPNDTSEPPLCWSDNGTAPSREATTPQSPTCMMCPHNVIGSAISKFTQAKIKACVDTKKLAFVIPGDPQNMIYLYVMKPGSFKNWTAYINWLKNQRFAGADAAQPYDVVTRLSFESQGVLKFEPAAAVPGNKALEAQLEAAWARGVSASITGQDDVPIAGQIAQGQPTQQLPPPPVQPQSGGFVQQTQAAPVPFVAQPAVPNRTADIPGAFAAASTSPIPSEPPVPRRRGRKPGTNATGQMPAQQGQVSAPMPNQAQPFQFPQSTPQPAPPPAYAPPQQQVTVAPASTVQAADPLTIPPFLRRQEEEEQPSVAPPPAPSFGFASPQTPSKDLQDAIDMAFSLPTK